MKKYALFTCDTEFTPPWNQGSWENQERNTFKEGIRIIKDILSEFGVRGTFFCQGLMVKEFPDIVTGLARDHLIGSHGYNHENYGGLPIRVYTKEQPVFLGDKKRKLALIHKCKAIHLEVLGKEPEVFVAPFNSIDYDLLEILEETSFKVDCSCYNYWLGLPSYPFKPFSIDLYELPLSVVRFDGYGYKNVLEGLTFDYGKISDILTRDIIYITCHPYEFIDIDIPHPRDVLIVGDEKVRILKRLIKDLIGKDFEFVDPLMLVKQTIT